jgi:hypothetical protein
MDIHDISYKAVSEFLDEYYPDVVYDHYDFLLDIILSGEINSAPDEIVNWIIAYNNRDNENIKIIKLSDILLNKVNLGELYQILNVNTKEDIIQILSYLHRLGNDLTIFNNLPREILKKILLDLDTDSLLLWFKSNKYLNFSSKLLLNDILKSKISLYSDNDTENLSIEQLISLIKRINIHIKRERDYIRNERSSSKNKFYDINELIKYAKELGLSITGTKKDLVDTILKDRDLFINKTL